LRWHPGLLVTLLDQSQDRAVELVEHGHQRESIRGGHALGDRGECLAQRVANGSRDVLRHQEGLSLVVGFSFEMFVLTSGLLPKWPLVCPWGTMWSSPPRAEAADVFELETPMLRTSFSVCDDRCADYRLP
jgi:hypothetical protein